MSTNSFRNVIVIGSMTLVIGTGVAIFAMRSHPAAVVARAEIPPSAPEPAAPLPEAAVPVPQAPAASQAVTPAAARPAPPTLVAATSQRVEPRRAANVRSAAQPVPKPATSPVAALAAPLATTETPPGPETASPAPVTSDSQITSDVQSGIAGAQFGADVHIGVTTREGVVVLTGNLPSQEEIDQVKAVASRVANVRSVDATALVISSL